MYCDARVAPSPHCPSRIENARRVRAHDSPSLTTRASRSLSSPDASVILSLPNWQGSAPRSPAVHVRVVVQEHVFVGRVDQVVLGAREAIFLSSAASSPLTGL